MAIRFRPTRQRAAPRQLRTPGMPADSLEIPAPDVADPQEPKGIFRLPRWIRWTLGFVTTGLAVASLVYLDIEGELALAMTWMQEHGLWGLVVLGVVYTLACVLFIPGTILTVAAGFLAANLWPQRFWLALAVGTAVASVSSLAGATLAFFLGRTLARDWLARRLASRPRMAALDRAVARQGFRIVLLLRLSPLMPFNILNFVLGVTRVRFRDYFLASWIGMLPATVLLVYAGTVAREFAGVVAGQESMGPGRTALFALGLVATLALVLVAARLARKALREADLPD